MHKGFLNFKKGRDLGATYERLCRQTRALLGPVARGRCHISHHTMSKQCVIHTGCSHGTARQDSGDHGDCLSFPWNSTLRLAGCRPHLLSSHPPGHEHLAGGSLCAAGCHQVEGSIGAQHNTLHLRFYWALWVQVLSLVDHEVLQEVNALAETPLWKGDDPQREPCGKKSHGLAGQGRPPWALALWPGSGVRLGGRQSQALGASGSKTRTPVPSKL